MSREDADIPPPSEKENPRPWYRRYAAAQFLVALVLVLISIPITEHYRGGQFAESIQLTVVLLAGLWAVGSRHRTVFVGLLLVTPALVGKWLDHWQPGLMPDWAFMLPAVLFVLFVVSRFLHFILRARHINSEVLCAGIAGYLLLGLLWAFGYTLVAQVVPGAFGFTSAATTSQDMHGFTALYFSFTTLTTVGYGDIVPLTPTARLLTMIETTVGIFYTTILIARLVTLYSSDKAGAASAEKPASTSQP